MTNEAKLARFDAMYAANAVHVTRLACKLVGADRAPDVSQDVWIRVWRHLDGFRDDAKPSSWLYRITQNVVIDHHRRSIAKTWRHSESLDELALEEWFVSPALPPDEAAYREEQRCELARRVARVPAPFQAGLLAYLSGMSGKDASIVFGVPVETVKSRTHRGRRLLLAQGGRHTVSDRAFSSMI